MPVWITNKLIGYALGALLASGLLWKGYDLIRDNINAVEDAKMELTNERVRRERADVSLALLQNTVMLEDRHDIIVSELKSQFEADVARLRTENEDQIKVLVDRERLQRVTMAKPKLIEKMANKATQERFSELETIINQ
jgi:hypothetical protein